MYREKKRGLKTLEVNCRKSAQKTYKMHKKEATSFIFKISSVFGLIMGPFIRIQILRYLYIFKEAHCASVGYLC